MHKCVKIYTLAHRLTFIPKIATFLSVAYVDLNLDMC